MASNLTDLPDAVNQLKERMSRTSRKGPLGALFVLGAGCSMQYGLPSFRQLLCCISLDLGLSVCDKSLEDIRTSIEKPWLRRTITDRRGLVERYVRQASGRTCPGYLHLARLAKKGYIKAFINLNFDLLLEEALDAEGVSYCTANTFVVPKPTGLVVYKPHGSIGELQIHKGKRDVILDIAKSDLFEGDTERNLARLLFTENDVVFIGYSGIDHKLTDVLQKKGENAKVFIVNVSEPNARLLYKAEQRDPEYLLVTGERANFENFMEQLELEFAGNERETPVLREQPPQLDEFDLMTDSESIAFGNCVQMARRIRQAMNVAERGSVGLIEHAREVFGISLSLSTAAGISLSSPEKYILRCASILHDLGYFLAYSGASTIETTGWLLLKGHGKMTVDLIKQQFAEEKNIAAALIPASYDKNKRADLIDAVQCICEFHSSIKIPSNLTSKGCFQVEVSGFAVPVRLSLLHALFAAAENIVKEHPFQPSSEPVAPLASDGRWAIEDPILDLYLRRKKGSVKYEIKKNAVGAYVEKEEGKKASTWLIAMTSEFIKYLGKVTAASGGWSLQFKTSKEFGFISDQESSATFLRKLLVEALEEELDGLIKTIEGGEVGEAQSLLDLIAIFSLAKDKNEPRVSRANSPVVKAALRRISSDPSHNILHLYLDIEGKKRRTVMELLFMEGFERIAYPAWRFFARNWSRGVEATHTARGSLDLGSSRFRGEVVSGLKHLFRERLHWHDRSAFGHDRCTLCTARLLHIFTSARQRFSREEFESVAVNREGKTLPDAVRGILRYFQSLDPEAPDWWGMGIEEHRRERGRSPDHAAWAAWALLFCLAVDLDVQEKTSERWLEDTILIDPNDVKELARDRWIRLFDIANPDFLSEQVEEPHSYTLGQFSIVFLYLRQLPKSIQDLMVRPEDRTRLLYLAKEIHKTYEEIRPLSHLSRLYLWPAATFLDSVFKNEECEDRAVDTLHECIFSPIWIREGMDAGSWGFNIKNTQTLVTSLTAFWRHAFAEENRSRFEKAISRYRAPARK